MLVEYRFSSEEKFILKLQTYRVEYDCVIDPCIGILTSRNIQ